MATEKEEIIIEVKVDQAAAITDLHKLEKAILNNKDAQKELATAYKSGKITQSEYIEENTRLQNNLKKEQDQKRLLTRAIDTESNSRNALKLKVNQLAKEYDNLNKGTTAGSARAKELEKQLSTLNAELSKGSKAAGLFREEIGHYPEQFRDAAKEIEIGGVSIGSIATKLSAFINPATAVVGVVGLLGAAYEHSAKGAEDFETAQNNLKATFDLLSNDIGNQTNGGIFTELSKRFSDFALASKHAGTDIKAGLGDLFTKSKEDAIEAASARSRAAKDENDRLETAKKQLEILRDLELDRLETNNKENQLQREAIVLQQTRDDQSKTFTERLEAGNQITEKFSDIGKETTKNLQNQLDAVTKYGVATGAIVNGVNHDRELKIVILNLQSQISAAAEEEASSNRRNAKALIALNNERDSSLKKEKEKLLVFEAQAKEFVHMKDEEANARMNNVSAAAFGEGGPEPSHELADKAKAEKDFNSTLREIMGERADIYMSDVTAYFSTVRSKNEVIDEIKAGELDLNQAYKDIVEGRADTYSADAQRYVIAQHAKGKAAEDEFSSLSNLNNKLAGLFQKGSDAEREFALASIAFDEAKAIAHLAEYSQANPLNAVTEGGAGAAEYISGFAEIIADFGAAAALISGFSEGGYTGHGGKHDPAGLVHKGEVVWSQRDVAMAGGPMRANAMRPTYNGYADGGVVTQSLTRDTNSQLLYANAIKDMPAPVVSVREVTLQQNRIQAKENIARL